MLIYSEIKSRGEKGCARIYLTDVNCGCICSYARFMHSEMGMTMGANVQCIVIVLVVPVPSQCPKTRLKGAI